MVAAMSIPLSASFAPILPPSGSTIRFAESVTSEKSAKTGYRAPEIGIYPLNGNGLELGYRQATCRLRSPVVTCFGTGCAAKDAGAVVALREGLAYVPASLRAPQLGRLFFESSAQ